METQTSIVEIDPIGARCHDNRMHPSAPDRGSPTTSEAHPRVRTSPHAPAEHLPIRLLIVDDSVVMRSLLLQVFEEAGGFDIRIAENGLQAIELNIAFKPDVVTLDVIMPKMDGIAALSRMLADRQVPVVMVSSMTEQGAFATLEALNVGAVDFITKPVFMKDEGAESFRDELLAKVRGAHASRLKELPAKVPGPRPQGMRSREAIHRDSACRSVVLIGASTGGPRTVEQILQSLPANFPWPIVVALHIPAAMSKALAERLGTRCSLAVVEASAPTILEPGTIYLAQGGRDQEFGLEGDSLVLLPVADEGSESSHPSLETLGRSLLDLCDPHRVIGVILTGRGSDGADAFSVIRRSGGRTIAESDDSAMVFEMPSALIRKEGATVVLPMEEIAAKLVEWVGE